MITSQKSYLTWLVIAVKWYFRLRGLSGGYWDWYSGVLRISCGHNCEHKALSCFSNLLECRELWLHFNPLLPFYNPKSSQLRGWFWTLCVFSCCVCLSAFFSLNTGIFLWRMKLLLLFILSQEEVTKFPFS